MVHTSFDQDCLDKIVEGIADNAGRQTEHNFVCQGSVKIVLAGGCRKPSLAVRASFCILIPGSNEFSRTQAKVGREGDPIIFHGASFFYIHISTFLSLQCSDVYSSYL